MEKVCQEQSLVIRKKQKETSYSDVVKKLVLLHAKVQDIYNTDGVKIHFAQEAPIKQPPAVA